MQQSSYQYIQEQNTFNLAVEALKELPIIALDLEFDRDRFAYGFTLCLIQVQGGDQTYLFDPFSLTDLRPLFDVFENPNQLKVMHAPSEDLQLLHSLGCYPKTLFDTERSARLLNYSAFSLGNLLNSIFAIELDKSLQKSDWTRIPLSNLQLIYAAQDVLHLNRLYEHLLSEAEAKGITNWLEEENLYWDTFRMEEKSSGILYNKDDAKRLPPFQLHVYNSMLQVRDVYARELNKPGYQVIDKNLLMDIVFKPEILDHWKSQKGLHPRVKNNDVALELKAAFNQGQESAQELGLLKFKKESRLGPNERDVLKQQKVELQERVETYIRPVWNEISAIYGEHTAAYILNEKTLTALVNGELPISELPFNYRKELLKGRFDFSAIPHPRV